jgi:hypothetical protein
MQHGADVFIDIGSGSLEALCGNDSFSFPLERSENGRLTGPCRERLTQSLRGFLSKQGKRARLTAWCAVEARGVSLRRLSLPAASGKEEFQRILRLQIESEFPLSPQDLAWGWRAAGPPLPGANGGAARQEVMVAAVKREMLEDYEKVLGACGVLPFFTVAALARAAFYPPPPAASGAVLHTGRAYSELVSFDRQGPVSIRIVPWGGENVTRSLQEKMGLNHEDAEKLKLTEKGDCRDGANALEPAVAVLTPYLKPIGSGARIYLTGKPARDSSLAPLLRRLLGQGFSCESLEAVVGNEHSAAIAGLKKSAANPAVFPLLLLDSKEDSSVVVTDGLAAWKWAAAAAALALAILFFPYLESVLLTPRLEKKLASINAEKGRLETIDEELAFLQDLKQEQPPYLETLYLLAGAAPQGTRLEPLSLSRRGDVSLRATMANGQQVTDFRSKLIDSGWFANVVVEEQSPTPDRRVAVRMTAQLKPLEARKPLAAETSAKKTAAEKEPKAKSGTETNGTAAVKPKS